MKSLTSLSLVILIAFPIGCAPSAPQWAPTRKTHTFQPATRQLAPPKIYSRLRWVNPPDVIPIAKVSLNPKVIAPVMQLDLKAATLKEAAEQMAQSVRYQSYCSSKISGRRITINSLGTIDELAQAVSDKAGIDVVVDHASREIRFLARVGFTNETNSVPSPLGRGTPTNTTKGDFGFTHDATKSVVEPRLFEEKVLADEHKSDN